MGDPQPTSNRIYDTYVRVLILVAISVGIFARVYAFNNNPPGLNQDEASIGYEAWSLAFFGIDRNGVSWPVQLISWGDGQNVLYAWLAIPFIKILGLSISTTRLPMLISGLLSLPLVYRIGSRLFSVEAGLGALLFVALSPWHIMMSRWALESNLLPFVFVAGLAFAATQDQVKPWHWISACAFWALCLYAYGVAYLSIPIFVLGAQVVFVRFRSISIKSAIAGSLVFIGVAAPVALFIAINTFNWSSVSVAGLTVPHMPATARFASQLNVSEVLVPNAMMLLRILIRQTDGYVYNSALPYGIMYSPVFFVLSLLFAISTVVCAITRSWPVQRMLIALWIFACLPSGLVQIPNINRTNLLIMGLVVSAGLGVGLLERKFKGILPLCAAALLVACGFFVRDYVTVQHDRIAPGFFDGLVPALQYAQSKSSGNICVTGNVNMPYIYALFTEQTDPNEFQRTVIYASQTSRTGFVASYGRYTFGLERCDYGAASVILARTGDNMAGGLLGTKTSFGEYDVIVLK